jgi:hypothetical protein
MGFSMGTVKRRAVFGGGGFEKDPKKQFRHK